MFDAIPQPGLDLRSQSATIVAMERALGLGAPTLVRTDVHSVCAAVFTLKQVVEQRAAGRSGIAAVPYPLADLRATAIALSALKVAIEQLAGQRDG